MFTLCLSCFLQMHTVLQRHTVSQAGWKVNINLGYIYLCISLSFFFFFSYFFPSFICLYLDVFVFVFSLKNIVILVIFMDHLKYDGAMSTTLPDKYWLLIWSTLTVTLFLIMWQTKGPVLKSFQQAYLQGWMKTEPASTYPFSTCPENIQFQSRTEAQGSLNVFQYCLRPSDTWKHL